MVGSRNVALERAQARVAGEMQPMHGRGMLGDTFMVMSDVVDECGGCLDPFGKGAHGRPFQTGIRDDRKFHSMPGQGSGPVRALRKRQIGQNQNLDAVVCESAQRDGCTVYRGNGLGPFSKESIDQMPNFRWR